MKSIVLITLIILVSMFNMGCNAILGEERGPAQQVSVTTQSSEEIPETYFIDAYMKQSNNILTRQRNFVITPGVIDLGCGIDTQFDNMFNINFYYQSRPNYLLAFNFQSDTAIQGLIDSGLIKSADLQTKLQAIKTQVRSQKFLVFTEQSQEAKTYKIRIGPKFAGQWVSDLSIHIEMIHQNDKVFLVTVRDDANIQYMSGLKMQYFSEFIYNSQAQAFTDSHPRYP